ncbi:MAG: hypothetical protein GY694_13730 [Gammaproteobacteria bacterium]|nr:hypothetical protein [Gammaproteobacteria bacterium]
MGIDGMALANYPWPVVLFIGLVGGLIFSYFPISKSSKIACAILGILGALILSPISAVAFPGYSENIIIFGAILGSVGVPFIVDSLKKNPK